MNTLTPLIHRSFSRTTLFVLALSLALPALDANAAKRDNWPPAPPLAATLTAEDIAPLPPSISAEPLGKGRFRCVVRFRPGGQAEKVALVGSFNNWDRDANTMAGPNDQGVWTAELVLDTGVYQYKFLVNNEDWYADPANVERVPDGYGQHNSLLRLGRLAQMQASPAKVGDNEIDTIGLAHQPPLPLYIQALGDNQVSVRYRTLAHDVMHVWLALADGATHKMELVSEGPLFAYWKTDVAVPGEGDGGPPMRGFEYTFVLDDGERVCDPYTYHYTLTADDDFDAPDWARDAVWYQILPDRFRNGSTENDPPRVRAWTSEWFSPAEWEGKDGQTFYQHFVFERHYGGDLAGIEEKLPYLKQLGVNALYLTPIFKAPSYHKYDVQNYIHVDDHFGVDGDYQQVVQQEDLLDPATWQWTASDERFLAFIRKAHTMGFRVILDAVFNHVGADHPAFEDVLKNGKQSRYADWFAITSWEPFAYQGWQGFAHMPVFRKDRDGFASAAVKAHLFAVTRRWMDPNQDGDPSDGIDGWRLDVPHDIPRPFWAEWRRLVKHINEDAFITGEVWQRADRWLDGGHFDAVMNYQFAITAVQWIFDQKHKISASAAAGHLAELRLAYPAEATYVVQNLINSHDTDRIASMAQNPDRQYDRQNRVQDHNPDYDNSKPSPEAYARARLAALLQMTYIGAPLIYYGDEVGMWGADDPSNRKPMLWEDLEPYAEPEKNHVMDDHLAYYRQVIGLRNEHPALRRGTFTQLLADDEADVIAFLRTADAEHVLVALNASGQPQTVRIPLPEGAGTHWTGLFGVKGRQDAVDGKLELTVPALGGVVLHAPNN